ncbi:MAG: sigma-70 family RNA polymerase sigma factor [Bergeyella sp.]|nr:sigma-70 family RNA polymerase sigma factor [Bergeyella sp.]
MYQSTNNKELLPIISSAKDKNPKAQTKLINTFWTDVFSYTLDKVKDKSAADEITVQTFSKTLSKLHLYDNKFPFKVWIFAIAKNTIIDHWRKKKNSIHWQETDLENTKNQQVKSPEDLLILEEERKRILRILDSMETKYQKIIWLKFFEEMSIKEISQALNLSISNTKIRLMRAKKKLAELLKEKNL